MGLHHDGVIMYKLDVAELSRNDFPQWDALVDNSAHGTIFHKTGFLDTCARSLGKKVTTFGCFQDGLLIGGCSLLIEQKLGLVSITDSNFAMAPYNGFVLSSPPGSGVHKQESFYRQVVESLISGIKKERFYSIKIRNSPDFLDIRPFTQNGWKSSVLYTYYIHLDDQLESHADHLVKKNIRKAEKSGIIIEPFSDISRYYTLLCETYARKNLPSPFSKSLLTELYSFIRDQNRGEMMAAKTPDDEIACAEIVVWDNRQAHAWSAVSDDRFNNSGSPSLLRFDDLKRMQGRGIPKMNMMTGNIPELSQFTAHLNPTLVPYYEVRSAISNYLLPFI